jgi:tetratricopeptide (TPR) repeat protein
LFEKVSFHPLSIHILAAQLKTRSIAELGERLDVLLSGVGCADEGGASIANDALHTSEPTIRYNEDLTAGLVASLQLSLERLEPTARALLPKLGVFQGGAFEDGLLEITGMAESQWMSLRRQLEASALIEAESLSGVKLSFLRFHPTLAPLLWAKLDAGQQQALSAAHRAWYYDLAVYLHNEDHRNTHAVRAIARRELPNLLHAVRAALQQGEAEAVDFANSVNRFLIYFGLRWEAEHLIDLAQTLASDAGSPAWILAQSNRGEQLFGSGRVGEAAGLFQAVLQQLGEETSYQRALTLGRLGRCSWADGQPDRAVQYQQQALAVLDKLESNESMRHLRGTCLIDLADALTAKGQYADARQAYAASLAIFKDMNDLRSQGTLQSQLGSLALGEVKLAEAAECYRIALQLFQTLQEPSAEASVWHQLGVVHQETRQWAEAERCYRESARINEALGDKSRAAITWDNLAIVNQSAGNTKAAEQWYRKAIEVHRAYNNPMVLAGSLNNLAVLLRQQPRRLAEARRLAEDALTIRQTLEPGAAEIWKTYDLLAEISEQEAEVSSDTAQPEERRPSARDYRRLALDAYRAFPGSRTMLLRKFAHSILVAVLSCLGQVEASSALAQHQAAMRQGGSGWAPLADAFDRLLAGERDAETLCAGLGYDAALIVETILQGLVDPASLKWLQAEPTDEAD